jgi:hypothetical protein
LLGAIAGQTARRLLGAALDLVAGTLQVILEPCVAITICHLFLLILRMPGLQCPLHLAPAPLPATFSMTPLDETTMRMEQCSS